MKNRALRCCEIKMLDEIEFFFIIKFRLLNAIYLVPYYSQNSLTPKRSEQEVPAVPVNRIRWEIVFVARVDGGGRRRGRSPLLETASVPWFMWRSLASWADIRLSESALAVFIDPISRHVGCSSVKSAGLHVRSLEHRGICYGGLES